MFPFALLVLTAGQGAPREQPDVEVGRRARLRQLRLERPAHRFESLRRWKMEGLFKFKAERQAAWAISDQSTGH